MWKSFRCQLACLLLSRIPKRAFMAFEGLEIDILAVFSSWVVWYGLKQYCSCRAFRCNSLDTPHGYICIEIFFAQNRAPKNWWPYFGPKFIHYKYSRVGCLESCNKMPCNNNTVLDHVKWPSWRKRPKKGLKKQLISHFGCFDPPNCPGSGLIKT